MEIKKCFICGKEFKVGRDRSRKGERRCCSSECKDKYLKTYTQDGHLKKNENGDLYCHKCHEYKNPEMFYNWGKH